MSIEARPMTAAEYEAWLPSSRVRYARDIVEAGIDPEAARVKSERDFASLLPDGVDTEGQDLYALVADGELVGSLWLAERADDAGPALFVYEVHVEEAHRGRGLGRAAMLFAEEEAARRGIPTVTLNVFGGNDVARNLYRSLGYSELAVYMMKRV